MRSVSTLLTLGGCLVAAGCSHAPANTTPNPTPPPANRPAPEAGPAERGPQAGDTAGPRGPGQRGQGGQAQAPRPYNRVVTAEAKTLDGLWSTHQIGNKLLFEIPRSVLDQDILVVPRVAKAPPNSVYGGQQVSGTQVVRWERRDHRIMLRGVSYDTYADPKLPIAQAVAQSNFGPVLGAFDVEAYGKDSSAVIDVTKLFTSPPPELSPGTRVYRGNPDQSRSFIDRVMAFPINVEIDALLTINPPPTPAAAAGRVGGFGAGGRTTTSLVMHWSMVKLPEKPMMPRLFDSRVGYFNTDMIDYGRLEHRAETRTFITRYRLEKKDPSAAMSEPIKPIVYYVDPATPKWLVPWVKKAITDWQPAFEAAGFKNAIIPMDAPNDPDWAPEDARYSVIRWLPSTTENAQGPHVSDPRSGEILEADIYIYHNVMNLAHDWYFTQVGHLDPRAQHTPMPDSLMGRLMEYVIAHEIGHTLGFQHNQKASSTYPVDSVRSATWVHKMGHTPTLMDYSRFNYTAQPEDHIALDDLIPGIGPYDKFATMWGYKPIPGASSPDAEKPTLDQWARMQDSIPWYRFNVAGSQGSDPGDQTEAVGDADAVRATGWGIQSLKATMPLVMGAASQSGENYDELSELYGRVVGQWATELRHVSNVVGGAQAQEKHVGQTGVRFQPLPRARQKEAVRFLNANAFATPTYFLDDEILNRIEVAGAVARINNAQSGVLNSLFNDRRMERMEEYEALAGSSRNVYPLSEMLADVRGGIWSELRSGRVAIDPYRRELQRSYLEAAGNKINPKPPELPAGIPAQFRRQLGPARATSDIESLFRAELQTLDGQLRAAIPKAANRETRAHLEDARHQIDTILHPKG